jgi:hypothetical protein
MLEKHITELLFLSESSEQRKIDVNCFPRLTPALKGKAAYEANPPALRLADILHLGVCLNDVLHVPLLSCTTLVIGLVPTTVLVRTEAWCNRVFHKGEK